jgi:hypothetical protein
MADAFLRGSVAVAMLFWHREMTRFGIFVCVMAALLGRARSVHAGPFEVKEEDWEGCSALLELARAELGARVVPVAELDWSGLTPKDSILLIHPALAISHENLESFLLANGRVAVLDDFGAGDKILEPFGIDFVPAPAHPLSTLRRSPNLAIAEPVTEPLDGDAVGVHATVKDVERVVTNHPMGLKLKRSNAKPPTPVLKIRAVDEPDVLLALSGPLVERAPEGPLKTEARPRGNLFAMGDPSVLINQMLRYPGNRAFAIGLLHWLAQDANGEPRGGRLFIIANRFSETGTFAGTDTFKNELEDRMTNLGRGLGRFFEEGFSGVVGLALATLVAFGVGVWTTTVSSRVYRRRPPSFARPVPLVAQGGVAGRTAVLSARTTPRALGVLELKSALEEGLAQKLGLGASVPTSVLLEEVKRKGALDEQGQRALKGALLEMANLETAVLARQAGNVRREDVLRLSRLVFGLLAAAEARRMSGERAA